MNNENDLMEIQVFVDKKQVIKFAWPNAPINVKPHPIPLWHRWGFLQLIVQKAHLAKIFTMHHMALR